MRDEFFVCEEDNEWHTGWDDLDISQKEIHFQWGTSNFITIEVDPENEHLTEKSINLAPFNSTISGDDLNIPDASAVWPRDDLIEFKGKAKKINIKYLRDHNECLDNGVYNEHS